MNKHIDYSYNWNNKLDCLFYTSLRLSGRFKIGDKLDVYLKNKLIHTAIVKDKRMFKLSKINNYIAGLDTGYSPVECRNILKKMYPQITDEQWKFQQIYFYLFQVDKTPINA